MPEVMERAGLLTVDFAVPWSTETLASIATAALACEVKKLMSNNVAILRAKVRLRLAVITGFSYLKDMNCSVRALNLSSRKRGG